MSHVSYCKGRKGIPGCDARITWIKTAASGGTKNISLDYKPNPDGNIAIEGGLAVVLTDERKASYDGKIYMPHAAKCPSATHFRGRATRQSPPLPFTMGEFDTPTARSVAQIEATALEITASRLADDFIVDLRRLHGKQDVYEYAAVDALFKDFRAEKKFAKDVAKVVVQFVRKEINVSEPVAA